MKKSHMHVHDSRSGGRQSSRSVEAWHSLARSTSVYRLRGSDASPMRECINEAQARRASVVEYKERAGEKEGSKREADRTTSAHGRRLWRAQSDLAQTVCWMLATYTRALAHPYHSKPLQHAPRSRRGQSSPQQAATAFTTHIGACNCTVTALYSSGEKLVGTIP